MPTQEVCEAAREQFRHSAAAISGCHQVTPEELKQRRHQPPADTFRVTLGL
jgi:hypothetical protein